MQCNKVPILTWWKIICRAPFSFIFVTVTMTASKNQLHLSPFNQVKWITISEWNIFIFAIIVIGISRMSRRLGRFTCWSFKSEGFKDILLERRNEYLSQVLIFRQHWPGYDCFEFGATYYVL